MKKESIKISVFFVLFFMLSIVSCGSGGKTGEIDQSAETDKTSEIKKISGTWEVFSGIVYDNHDFKVIYPEKPFDENLKWKLVITNDGKITKPADNEYDDEQIANYKLYTGDEAMEKGLIEKKHRRRAAVTNNDDMLVFVTDKQIIDERLFQIVNCTSDTLTIRFLSSSKLFSEHLYEYKLVKK